MKHSFIVKDLCKLESLQGIQVLAGNEQLQHPVENINVMEVPDIDKWVQPNEFLMTTGYMFKENPGEFISLIPRLKERNVAALGIKTKRFIEEIPYELIQCAQAYDFPLLLLPEKTAFSIVIREGMEHILLSEKERKSSFLKKLITGTYKSQSDIINALPGLNLNYTKDSKFTIFIIAEKEDHVTYEKEALYSRLAYCFRNKGFECHHVIHQNHLVIFLSYSDKSLEKKISKKDRMILQHLKDYNCIICEYNRGVSIDSISSEYTYLLKMQKAVESSSMSSSWVSFNELGLYSAIPDMADSLFFYFSRNRYVEPIKEYDRKHGTPLLDTLKTYFSCNCNMRDTAKQMYTHYNTVCHRIDKIEEILGVDLDSFHDRCTLYLSLLLQ